MTPSEIRRSLRSGAALPLSGFLLAAVLCGCARNIIAVPDLRGEIPPRSVLLVVDVPPEGCCGSEKDWVDEFLRWFTETGLFTTVVTEGEFSPGSPDESTDMRLELTLSPRQPKEPEIDGQAAFLDFIAWSSVPPVAWWIRDVLIDPGVTVRIRWSLNTADPVTEGEPLFGEPEEKTLAPVVVATSLTDRHSVVSWASLGAVAAPPFVFRGVDREHMIPEIGGRVRFEAARAVVETLIDYPWGDHELLTNLELVQDANDTEFAYTAAPDVGGRLHLWFGGEWKEMTTWTIEPGAQSIRLTRKEGAPATGRAATVRAIAINRKGRVCWYSLPIGREEYDGH